MSSPRGRGQNRRAIARGRSSTPRARLDKTAARPRGAGGRPLTFIPIAVVARAAELERTGLDFSTVVRVLEREGNGAWPRKTLLRRVRAGGVLLGGRRGQKGAVDELAGAGGRAARAVAKTNTRASRYAVLEAAAVAAAYDTPAYHQAVAAMHASRDSSYGRRRTGPCGCYSCGHAKAAH